MNVRRVVLPLLLVLNAVLLAWLASRWLTPQGRWIDVAWQPPAALRPTLQAGAPLAVPAVDTLAYLSTLERPLFSSTRRPPQPPPPPAPPPAAALPPPPPPPDPLPDVRLVGLYGNDKAGGVLLRVDNRLRRVRIGDTFDGWSVQRVGRQEIEVTRGGESRRFVLTRDVIPDPVAAVPAPGAAPAGAAADPNAARAAALSEAQRRELQERRAQIQRMNALRAQMGAPPLPVP